MSGNLLDQLAQVKVPPPPEKLDAQVHDRLNGWLLATQMSDLVLRGFFYAAAHFARAVWGMIGYTAAGEFRSEKSNE